MKMEINNLLKQISKIRIQQSIEYSELLRKFRKANPTIQELTQR